MMIRSRSAACRCVSTSLECLQTEPDLLRRVITADETWIFEYDPETKRQSRTWKQDSQNQKATSCWSRSSMSDGEFLPQGQTINQQACNGSGGFCFAQCARRYESCGRTNRGCFTTTLQRPTALGPIHSYGPCSQRPEHPVVPGREEHRRTGTTSLFTWSCSVWLFSFPQAQGDYEGDSFWSRGGHQEGRNDRADGHPRTILPAVHRSVTEKDGWGLLWRGNHVVCRLELK